MATAFNEGIGFNFIGSPERPVGADEKGFTAIFNGKNFDDWDGKPEAWEVRNGETVYGKISGKELAYLAKRPAGQFHLRSNSVGTKVTQSAGAQ